MSNVIELSDRLVAAYNAKDFAALKALIHPELDFAHFNRGFAFHTREELLQILEVFAGQLMPDRRMLPPERVVSEGSTVVRVAMWEGTAQAPVPGFGAAGDKISVKLCSVLRFDEAGLLREWKDFG